MRLTAFVGLFLCLAIFATNDSKAHAEIDNQKLALGEIKVADVLKNEIEIDNLSTENKEEKPLVIEYIVKSGDRLSEIAESHNTSWQRIFAKNQNISDPNIINVGEKLLIPDASEVLAERPITSIVEESVSVSNSVSSRPKANRNQSTATSAPRGSSAGNTYTPGYCTYYAKQRRPDLPNNLGNASTWVSRARAQGLSTGSTPKAGAIGQSGNHVVYVERVNADGTITISDMNWVGRWKISTRTVPANSHTYIY